MSRLLIVDDNVAFAENLAEIMTDLGHEVAVAESGARAISLAEQDRFDVLVSDMRMPRMSGLDVVREMRRIDADLPALIVSAYTADHDQVALRAGIIGILPKPVPVPRLLQLLTRARRHGVVAVVDDDQALVDNLSEILRDNGFSPLGATTLEELELLPDAPLLCAVVDLRLPGWPDGEAMHRLARRFPGVPLVVATGYSEVAPPLPALRTLRKPVSPGALLEELEALHASYARP